MANFIRQVPTKTLAKWPQNDKQTTRELARRAKKRSRRGKVMHSDGSP